MRFRVLLLVVFAALVVTGAVSVLSVSHQKAIAEDFLELLKQVEPGVSTSAKFQALLARCRSHCKVNPECADRKCREGKLTFQFDNSLLARFHMARLNRLAGSVNLLQDHIDFLAISYSVATERDMTTGVTILEFPAATMREPLRCSIHPVAGKPSNVSITLTPAASSDQKAQVFSLDLKCLLVSRGCTHLGNIFPALESPDLGCARPQADARVQRPELAVFYPN